ncbi:MAG TPA: transcription termination/antitermination protein NusA [Alphaproteobacteria bacterium]|nr:transcription termination/antitermination protein NusA [Alphaproteobacteria bacterium]HIN92543.1 transcription termination/antitermination protein NusA [Alphaproteobacteria bacterium]
MLDDVNQGLVRPELLQVADAVARDKTIDREIVIQAMEQAIQTASRRKYGQELEIRAEIDRKTGEIRLNRVRHIVEEVEDDATQLSLEAALAMDPNLEVGGELTEPLPPIDLGRVAAQAAKQVIVQRVREAERARQYEEYKDRAGEIVNGLVKRTEYGNIIVDLGRGEAVLRRDESLPRENFRNGDRVRALVYEVREETRGPQIFLSRTRPELMAKLFGQEVPEIYDAIIEIKAVARDPGSRAKIAVLSHDSSIDPVGACVGMRGSRVQAVVNELQGEKIDIIQWNPDPATFIVNALAPAEVTKVVLDEDQRRIEVVVPDEQLSLAIGRRGQNVRLASNLTGWEIDIMTEGQESERRVEEFRSVSQVFIDQLNVDDVIAHLLVTEGFADVEAVAFVPIEELGEIEGFDETLAGELRQRARSYLVERDAKLSEERRALGVSDEVASIEGLSPARVVMLGKTGIKSLDDLADLASDELREIVGEGEMSIDEADAVIMAARAHWFDDDFGGKGIGQVDIDKSGGNPSADAVEGGMLADDKSVEAAVIGGDDASSNAPEAEADDASGAVD